MRRPYARPACASPAISSHCHGERSGAWSALPDGAKMCATSSTNMHVLHGLTASTRESGRAVWPRSERWLDGVVHQTGHDVSEDGRRLVSGCCCMLAFQVYPSLHYQPPFAITGIDAVAAILVLT
jgi:hypothetical protein